ncbi:HAD domain-containing protein [Cupriavidus campinensis]|uniref:HAD domain-containing protein n=1 Tax=Burkholderiales TaxID=80840 RepID=UPI002069FD4F|nr:HAD domain-containing protein [Cupriavidus campinensis]UOB05887.1 HAD domain-containing protein [Diaphorobacter sp. LI3]
MLLFLDFDGVMHPVGCSVDRYFCHLDLVQDWLRRHPAIKVVISSSWRTAHPLDEIQSYFAEDLGHRVIGTTPIGITKAGELPSYEREAGIEEFLARNSLTNTAWVAIDDQPHLFSPACDRLVVCDGAIGLTYAHLEQVDCLLAQ